MLSFGEMRQLVEQSRAIRLTLRGMVPAFDLEADWRRMEKRYPDTDDGDADKSGMHNQNRR
jgi:hypothetical protein